ncbi:hypothetical protein HPB47_020196 [Ixodes persulcatus]|uniref:Uncharacterized protein n=1 Tax=Ixodes persulcatus TaxID=34615 RepID=A0AC60QJJ6_IXOPE|nr:hypothetical protein HPB47_020196 [Ixodes persulcatus]
MREALPVSDFEWMTKDEIACLNIDDVPDDAPTGYILEVYCATNLPRRNRFSLNMTRYWDHCGDLSIFENLLLKDGAVSNLGAMDGIDMWQYLTVGFGSPRKEVLLTIDLRDNLAALRYNNYKLVVGEGFDEELDGRYSVPGGLHPTNDVPQLRKDSRVARVLKVFYRKQNRNWYPLEWSKNPVVDCRERWLTSNFVARKPPYLFDHARDPCELYNLAGSKRIKAYAKYLGCNKQLEMCSPSATFLDLTGGGWLVGRVEIFALSAGDFARNPGLRDALIAKMATPGGHPLAALLRHPGFGDLLVLIFCLRDLSLPHVVDIKFLYEADFLTSYIRDMGCILVDQQSIVGNPPWAAKPPLVTAAAHAQHRPVPDGPSSTSGKSVPRLPRGLLPRTSTKMSQMTSDEAIITE